MISIKEIPSWVWCSAAVIGVLGGAVYIICKGEKYTIDATDRSDQIKWLRKQMEQCEDNERYLKLAEMLGKLLECENSETNMAEEVGKIITGPIVEVIKKIPVSVLEGTK